MSDKAAGQKARSPEACDENGPAAALLLSHVSIQICSFLSPVRLGPPCRRPILIATPLPQSLTWCTSYRPLMNYPYANFYLEAQRAKRNLLHVFKAEPDLPVVDPVLLAAKCAPAEAKKRKLIDDGICQNCFCIHVNS